MKSSGDTVHVLRHCLRMLRESCSRPDYGQRKVIGWATLAVAMTYIHASEGNVLAAFAGQENRQAGELQPKLKPASNPQAIEQLEGYMVSAAGFEPATHALKGHCSTN